jgi:hypothetical protein
VTVYLHCEGDTDYAVIPHLLKKASNQDMDIQWIKWGTLEKNEQNNQKRNKFRLHRKSGIVISAPYKYIKELAIFSLLHGSKYIAYHQDADRKYDEVYSAIISQFKPLREKGFHCLAIVPKEMIESWLLADPSAYSGISQNQELPQNPKLPSKPEDIFGDKNDPQSKYPKSYLERVLNQFGLNRNRETYADIAKGINPDVVREKCPISFGQFYEDMQSFITGKDTP